MRQRRLLPRPAELPSGKMLFYRRVVPVKAAEDHGKMMMRGFDNLPPLTRAVCNAAPVWPTEAATLVARFGDRGAAERIIQKYTELIFKSRDRSGVHP